MAGIPKNVMQIGQTDAHVKIYMEDYVHTFLERCRDSVCLAFGRKEETDGISYYLIYGVEKKQDWERGSFPYFKNLERIGEIEGKDGKIRFKTVQGREIPVQGYFIFYEQNEDMQSYMIAERESRDAQAQKERERVMEEVQLRREKRRQEAETQEKPVRTPGGKANVLTAGRALRKRYLRANAAALKKPAPKRPAGSRATLAGVCRIGCAALLLILAATGLASVKRDPDRAAQIFADTSERTDKKDGAGLIVEEAVKQAEPEETAAKEPVLEETEYAEDIPVQADGEIRWLIGEDAAADAEAVSDTEAALDAEAASDATAASDMAAASDMPTASDTEAASDATAVSDMSAASDTTTASDTEAVSDTATASDTAAAPPETASAESEPEPEAKTTRQPEPANPDSQEKYTVQKGDSLARIARRFYGNASYVSKICDLNGIEDPDRITPGQNILLP